MPHELGWPLICLPVSDLRISIEFYEKLDYTMVIGSVEDSFAGMMHRNHEISLHQGHLNAHMLNFRGGDVRGIVEELRGRGLKPQRGHVESDGEAVDVHDCTSACYFDPDGLEIMFDTHPDEARRFAAGESFCTEDAKSRISPGTMLLGNFTYCIDCRDIRASVGFYRNLGFHLTGDFLDQNWGVMTLEEKPEFNNKPYDGLHLSLFQGMLKGNMLNWRGGNVFAIARMLESRGVTLEQEPFTDESGSDNLMLKDPDGHQLYFNTYPQERLY